MEAHMNIAEANVDYSGTTNGIYSLNWVSGTSTSTTIVYRTDDNFGELANKNYVVRKIKTEKKKRGSLEGVNSQDKRLKVLKPVVIFKFIKNRFTSLQEKRLSKRLENVCRLLEIAEECNQIALKDKIRAKFGKFLREQEIISCEFNQAISAKTIEGFIAKTGVPGLIKLTKLKNYIRIIPAPVRKKLQLAQKAKLFDDYLILHTDPDDKAVEKTAEEKRDPILFGVVAESPLYYVIGDWEDKYCDITMDKIIEVLGRSEESFKLETDVELALDEVLGR